jgi:hypothetical protein
LRVLLVLDDRCVRLDGVFPEAIEVVGVGQLKKTASQLSMLLEGGSDIHYDVVHIVVFLSGKLQTSIFNLRKEKATGESEYECIRDLWRSSTRWMKSTPTDALVSAGSFDERLRDIFSLREAFPVVSTGGTDELRDSTD